MGNKTNKTKAKPALIMAGVCNTVATLIHLAITAALIYAAVLCWEGSMYAKTLITPLFNEIAEPTLVDLLIPIVLRCAFVLLVRVAIDAFVLFALNLATAIDCYSHANKEPEIAVECKGGLAWCGVFEVIGAIVLGGIGVLLKSLPNMVESAQELAGVLSYGFIAFVVIAGLLLICAIIKFIASGILGKEKRELQ